MNEPDDLAVYTNAGVDASIPIRVHMRSPEDRYVTLVFGDERLTLSFFDVESLEQLSAIAHEGAQLLRAACEADTEADTEACPDHP
jgi:hypothetical protein